MRHVILTCKNHPELRWSCKSVAFSPGYGYNGCRNIFYNGRYHAEDASFEERVKAEYASECSCHASDLILAPEEEERQKLDPTYTPEGWDIA